MKKLQRTSTKFKQDIMIEIADLLLLHKLNGQSIELKEEGDLEAIADSILFDIEGESPDSYDLDDLIKWNLEQYATHA
tara:strand:- start:38 stop:271 length:234 start_codon:yes stop_codon:yes gene_type:complete